MNKSHILRLSLLISGFGCAIYSIYDSIVNYQETCCTQDFTMNNIDWLLILGIALLVGFVISFIHHEVEEYE